MCLEGVEPGIKDSPRLFMGRAGMKTEWMGGSEVGADGGGWIGSTGEGAPRPIGEGEDITTELGG